MGKLRDFFARANLCESTAEIARKPALIASVVDYSIPRTRLPENMTAENYAHRLQYALHEADNAALEFLLQKDIAVCLDQRLGALGHPVFSDYIMSVYYPDAPQKILSLYDKASQGGVRTFFNDSGVLNGADSVNTLASYIRKENPEKPCVGFVYVDGRGGAFLWSAAEYKLKENKALLTPPVPAGP